MSGWVKREEKDGRTERRGEGLVTSSMTEERKGGCAVMNQQGDQNLSADDASVLQQSGLIGVMEAYRKCWL